MKQTTMKTTNNTQEVGGDHYQLNGDIEPVHLMVQLDLNWFQGEILKYVSRHWNKNGKVDLQKAMHICDMAIDFNLKYRFKTKMLKPSQEILLDNYCKQYISYYKPSALMNEEYSSVREYLNFKNIIKNIVTGYYASVKSSIEHEIEIFYGKE